MNTLKIQQESAAAARARAEAEMATLEAKAREDALVAFRKTKVEVQESSAAIQAKAKADAVKKSEYEKTKFQFVANTALAYVVRPVIKTLTMLAATGRSRTRIGRAEAAALLPAAAAAQATSLNNVQVIQGQAATALVKQTTSLPELVAKAQGLQARMDAGKQKTADLLAQMNALRASMHDIQSQTIPELNLKIS